MVFCMIMSLLVFPPGPLATSVLDASAFIRSKYQPREDKFPYIQIHTFNLLLGNDGTEYMKYLFNKDDEASIDTN